MYFSSPIWLILLGPWTALAIWLLRGKFPVQGVPFLELWRREAFNHERPVRAWIWPPVAVLALLGAMLLGILAAGGPMVHSSGTSAQSEKDVPLESLAVRDWPAPQAMVRVGNQSDLSQARLTFSGGNILTVESIELPARGGERNYFVDLTDVPQRVTAMLSAGPVEHLLEVQRAPGWPAIDARRPLPAAVSRMIDVYSGDRNPDQISKHIAVLASAEDVKSDEPTAIIIEPKTAERAISPDQPMLIRDSPITRDIDWEDAVAGATISSPPGVGWQSLVSAGDEVLVAAQEQPIRKVWIGFQSDDFPRRADFVVFWNNVFNWLGESDWRQQVATAQAEISSPPAGPVNPPVSMAGQTLLVGLGMVVLAAFSWKSRPRSAR